MINIADKEIAILKGQHNLTSFRSLESVANTLFGLLEDDSIPFAEMSEYLATDLQVTIEKSREILLDGAYLYFDQLTSEKKAQVESWFQQYHFDKKRAEEELTLEKGDLIDMPTLYYTEAENISREILDLFTNHLSLLLSAKDEENQQELNSRLMFLILFWEQGSAFRDELLKIIDQNSKLLSKDKLRINNQVVEPTAANWLKDFEANVIIAKELTISKKVAYFNNSINFKNLTEVEKIIIADFLDLYWRLKYFPQNMENQEVVDWYIVPFHKTENKKFDILSSVAGSQEVTTEHVVSMQARDLTKAYQQTLSSIIDKYKVADNLNAWENKTPLELINALETSSRPEIILPALVTLVKNNKDLAILTTNTALQRSLALANGDLTGILKALFVRAGLNDQEGIVMAIRLSQDNKSLSGLAYGDLKSGAFHWR